MSAGAALIGSVVSMESERSLTLAVSPNLFWSWNLRNGINSAERLDDPAAFWDRASHLGENKIDS